MIRKKKHVFTALSGGVDSAVSAALLQNQGYEVTGVFMKNWSDCNWAAEKRDAIRACAALGIPFRVFDFEQEYRERVVSYMISEYRRGRTPNPDVLCNAEIKFRLFLDAAMAAGADSIATGHYARGEERKGNYHLKKGLDPAKDQSYFLCRLGQSELARTFFPVGAMTKKEVRALARNLNLPVADKKDSQGICFVGEVNLERFLSEFIPQKEGKILAASGEELGRHRGAPFYTIGQRHGLGIGGGVPYFVVSTDVPANTVTVAPGAEHPALFSTWLIADSVYWVSGHVPKFPFEADCLIRYRGSAEPCLVSGENGQLRIAFAAPQRAVTPGQFAVLYRGDELLGSAVITTSSALAALRASRPALVR